MHHVPFIKTRSLSHLPHFCRPKRIIQVILWSHLWFPNHTSNHSVIFILPSFYLSHPSLPLLPSLFRLLHLCFLFLITTHQAYHCCQLTSSNTTSILPSLYLQGWGCSPLLQNGIPIPSWSHLRLLFHSYFSWFLKIEALLKPAWCTHYSPINHKTFMS